MYACTWYFVQVYVLKASHVPQTKLHQKLIQATQVIIALVREKEQLNNHIKTLLNRNPLSRDQVCKLQHQSTQTHEQKEKLCDLNEEVAGGVGLKLRTSQSHALQSTQGSTSQRSQTNSSRRPQFSSADVKLSPDTSLHERKHVQRPQASTSLGRTSSQDKNTSSPSCDHMFEHVPAHPTYPLNSKHNKCIQRNLICLQ